MPRPSAWPSILTASAILAFWVANRLIQVPVEWVAVGSAVVAGVFLALQILAIYYASALQWRPAQAVLGLGVCLAALGLILYLQNGISSPTGSALATGLLQLARLGWPMCLGLLIGSMLRDKNMLLPIAIVLASVDIIAVLAPAGTVRQGLQSPIVSEIFSKVAIEIPKFGLATPAAQAQMGPADPLFLAMFFCALHRFRMKAPQTLIWMLPALILFLCIVIFFGDYRILGLPLKALPALVPMGIVILIVNWQEFDLSPEERAMTFGVLVVCLILIVAFFLLWRKPAHVEERAPSRPLQSKVSGAANASRILRRQYRNASKIVAAAVAGPRR